jgi:hypothetical protein
MKHLELSFKHEYNDIRDAIVLNGERFLTFIGHPMDSLEEAENAAEFLEGVCTRLHSHSIADVIDELIELEKDKGDLGRFAFICGCHLTNTSGKYRKDVLKHLIDVQERHMILTRYIQEMYIVIKFTYPMKRPDTTNGSTFAALSAIIMLASMMTIMADKKQMDMDMLEMEMEKRGISPNKPKDLPETKNPMNHFNLN